MKFLLKRVLKEPLWKYQLLFCVGFPVWLIIYAILLGLIVFITTTCNGISSNTNSLEATNPPKTYQPSSGVVSVELTQTSTPVPASTSTPKTTSTFTPNLMITLSPAPTPLGGGTGKIIFSSDDNIYMMNIDGSDPTKTDLQMTIFCPVLSPDGQKIVFEALSHDIYMLNITDKSQPKRIVDVTPWHGDGAFICPVWSPDGHKLIVMAVFYPQGVYMLGIDDSLKALTLLENMSGASWSPDGQRIVFSSVSANELKHDIWLMNADGSGLSRLTDTTGHSRSPAWSPDGQTIAFVSDREVEDSYEIYLMNPDGSNQRRLTQTLDDAPIGREVPTWSPDSRYIVYIKGRLNDNQWPWIYIINADGTEQRQLIKGVNPAWSPDSQHLAFTVGGDILLIDADGSHLIKLRSLSFHPRSLVWQPSPTTIH